MSDETTPASDNDPTVPADLNEASATTPETVAEVPDAPPGGTEIGPLYATPPAVSAPLVSESGAGSSIVRHRAQFAFIYVVLGACLVAAAIGFATLVVEPGIAPAAAWSNWTPPSGSTSSVESAIASHISGEYRLNKKSKSPLVAVISKVPEVTSGTTVIPITEVAVRTTTNSDNYAINETNNTWTYELCGLGPACAIATGQASTKRDQDVRREALELALYTFKFSSLNSLVTYMPPPDGSPAGELLYFQKSNYAKELSQPLDKTLTLAKPPLPTQTDSVEKTTIDKLTLPEVYSYSLTALQDGSAALVLNPVGA